MAKKLLIVEDDQFLRELVAKKIREENYEVVEASDGEEGLKKVKEAKPDLVLLDLMLPGIDGFHVLEQIKKDSEISKTPVIILSNLGQKEDIDKGMNLGAEDFLVKAHFTPGEIIEKVKIILG
ncbi:MAG: response regulator [Candidatus Pacebacteria bacterium]|nr:response regulator [Candidatus Paceibacterota bacterium]